MTSNLSMFGEIRLFRIALWVLMATLLPGLRCAEAAPEGIALAIVYDTSGSMLQRVPDADGNLTPKYVIASRAILGVLDQLQDVTSATNGFHSALQTALVVFQGDHAGYAVKLGPFDPAPFRRWLREHRQPQRGTPLGDAVQLAGEAVLQSSLPRKHILIITDGINTKGPDPTVTIPKLQRQAERQNSTLAIHFIAFDVNANVFAGVKRLGATLVGAANEKQLNAQLEHIVAKKILLEDEELQPTPPKQN